MAKPKRRILTVMVEGELKTELEVQANWVRISQLRIPDSSLDIIALDPPAMEKLIELWNEVRGG